MIELKARANDRPFHQKMMTREMRTRTRRKKMRRRRLKKIFS
jgi:hypothetical protein